MPASIAVVLQRTLFRFLGLAGVWLLLLMSTGRVYAQSLDRAVLVRARPEYPALALRMHVSGIVRVHATVNPDGTVSQVQATNGHALLQGPAMQAVRQYKFAKAPAPSEVDVEVNFVFDNHS